MAARRAALIGALLALGCPSAARAELSITVRSSPSSAHFGVTQRIAYTVALTATGRDEVFRFGVRSGGFGVVAGEPVEGSPISFADQTLELQGGTLLGPAAYAYATPACAPDVAPHGTDRATHMWDVRVPANTTAIATLPFEIWSASAPWPDTSYGVTVFANAETADRAAATLAAPIELTVRGPRIAGRRGVHIRLASTPASGLPSVRDPVVGRRRPIIVRGSTSPARRNDRLRLIVTDWRARHRARTVRTDARGRFSARLSFDHAGRYEVGARYTSRWRTIASDYACPLGFRVR